MADGLLSQTNSRRGQYMEGRGFRLGENVQFCPGRGQCSESGNHEGQARSGKAGGESKIHKSFGGPNFSSCRTPRPPLVDFRLPRRAMASGQGENPIEFPGASGERPSAEGVAARGGPHCISAAQRAWLGGPLQDFWGRLGPKSASPPNAYLRYLQISLRPPQPPSPVP